jgi:hypothetical protein
MTCSDIDRRKDRAMERRASLMGISIFHFL